MNQKIIKSRERIKDHGEVFTPDFLVQDMLCLVKNEVEIIESRFLEPACGDGNFLAPVLARKLDLVDKRYKKNQSDYEKYSFIAVSSIYGIDILKDNVDSCRSRLFDLFKKNYVSLFKKKINNDFLNVIEFILECNILHGDALSLKKINSDDFIIFSEWSFTTGGLVKRRDFIFQEMGDFNPESKLNFSIREKSDNGADIFSPMPLKDYKSVHYLKVINEL